MKITVSQLRRIIKEEVSKAMNEASWEMSPEEALDKLRKMAPDSEFDEERLVSFEELMSMGITPEVLKAAMVMLSQEGEGWIVRRGNDIELLDPALY